MHTPARAAMCARHARARTGAYARCYARANCGSGAPVRAAVCDATRDSANGAGFFAKRAMDAGYEPVIFKIEIDETDKCCHVNYITPSVDAPDGAMVPRAGSKLKSASAGDSLLTAGMLLARYCSCCCCCCCCCLRDDLPRDGRAIPSDPSPMRRRFGMFLTRDRFVLCRHETQQSPCREFLCCPFTRGRQPL